MSNLKPCPFCGGVAELKAPGYEHYSPCWVKCTQCGAEGPTKSSEVEAEKGWNERAQEGLELLKDQEAVAPKIIKGPNAIFTFGLCGKCDTVVRLGDKYCNGCGRRLLWDGNERKR